MAPWSQIAAISEELQRLYDPGDDSPTLPRCDAAMLVDTATGGRCVLQAALVKHEEDPAVQGCLQLMVAVEAVSRGLAADLRDACDGAHEQAEDLARLRGLAPNRPT